MFKHFKHFVTIYLSQMARRVRFSHLALTLLVLSTLLFNIGFDLFNLKDVSAANGLVLTKTQDGNPVLGGQTTYTIKVTNDGTNGAIVPSAYNLNIIDTLPPGMAYVSSTGAGLGAPTITTTGAGCGLQQTLTWKNIKDLAANETYVITITAQLNACILVNTNLVNNVNTTVSSDPRDVTGPISAGGASSTGIALPFKLTKVTVQSTGVGQDTGACAGPGAGRQFYYKLTVQNNYVGPSQNMIVTDTLPDGVAYCGTMNPAGGGSNLAPTVGGPDPATGQTVLTWNLNTLATGQQVILQPDVVILYQYRGTNNGGPNAFIPDQTNFTNTSNLNGTYLGINYTSGPATSDVVGRYATIAKRSSVATVATGDIVTYTLTPSTSTNYDASNMYIIDTVPNGQDVIGNFSLAPSDAAAAAGIFVPCGANANLVPPIDHGGVFSHTAGSGVYVCLDGTSQISWGRLDNSGATPMTAGTQFNITFDAQVRLTYRNGTQPPVLAGDSFLNNVGMRFDADSIPGLPLPNQGAGGLTTRNRWENASAGQTTSFVSLNKNILGVTRGDGTPTPPNEGRVTGLTGVVTGGPGSRTLNRTAVAAIGDIVTFQIEFNGSITADMRNIIVRDFLPLNYVYLNNTTTYCDNSANAYTGTVNGGAIAVASPACNTPGPNPTYTAGAGPLGAGGVAEWPLTGVAGNNITPKNSIFRLQFKAQVTDLLPNAATGFGNDNLAKVSGVSTSGASYSDRDIVTVTTIAPNLTVTKTASVPTVTGNDVFNYAITIANTGNVTAYQVANLVDTLPNDIRYNSTVSITASPAACSSAAFVSYTPNTTPVNGFGGTLTYSMSNIPPGCSVTITHQAQVQPSPVVGTVEPNTATIATYQSQPTPATTPLSRTYGPAQGSTSVLVGGQTLTKTGTIHQPQVNGVGSRLTIGDRVDYILTFILPPNATFPNGEIRDCLPRGFRYIAGTYSGSSGSALPGPGVLPANDAAAGFSVVAGNGPCASNQDYVIVNFGTQNNTGGAINITLNLSASISGIDRNNVTVFNTVPGANNSQLNSAYVFANSNQQGNPATSPSLAIYIPNLTLNKALIRPSSPTPGGVSVDFLLTLSNTGGAPAYDIVSMIDTLDPGLAYVGAYLSDSTCSLGTLVAGNLVPGATAVGQVVTIPVTPGNTPPASLTYLIG